MRRGKRRGCACGQAPVLDRRGGLVKPGLERAHVKPGSGKGQVKTGSGTRAGQIRNGKGRHKKRKKRRGDAGFYQRLLTGVLTKGFTGQQKTLVFTQVFT